MPSLQTRPATLDHDDHIARMSCSLPKYFQPRHIFGSSSSESNSTCKQILTGINYYSWHHGKGNLYKKLVISVSSAWLIGFYVCNHLKTRFSMKNWSFSLVRPNTQKTGPESNSRRHPQWLMCPDRVWASPDTVSRDFISKGMSRHPEAVSGQDF